MDLDYWKKRWQEDETGWHHDEVHPLLQKYYDLYNLSHHHHFFFPLCGKTLDIDWALEKGHQVTCVEVSTIAIEEIAKRLHIHWRIENNGPFTVYSYDKLTIYQGDFFSIPKITFPKIDFVFDRAAVVAVDPSRRKEYANIYAQLQPSTILFILYRYDKKASTAPPFSFESGEIQNIINNDFEIKMLETKEILNEVPKFKSRNIDEFYREVYLAQISN